MAYRNIKDIVSQSFEQGRDLRIEHTIENNGASHLLSAVYNNKDAEERKFYRKPKLAEGEETKLAILYGETMITPYIIDVGVANGINDPASITRTIRFIAGDGETEGVVIGANGSLLENVYMGSEGESPQPVLSDSGVPSTKDVILASALGGLIDSVPKIWDALFNDAPDADEIKDINKKTGEKLKSNKEKRDAKELSENLRIEQLLNVCDDETPYDGYILVYDNCKKEWCPKHINELMTDAITTTGGVACVPPTMGTPGTSGRPGTPATAEVELPADPVELPDDSLQKELCQSVERSTVAPFIELVDISALEDNEYFETRDTFLTWGIQFHFLFEGIGIWETWEDDNAVDAGSDMPCLTGEQTNNPNTVTELVAGSVDLRICISTVVCGEEYVFYNETFTVNGLSETDFTQHIEIEWSQTDIAILRSTYGSQISTDYNIRIRRMDGKYLTGCPKSIYPVHYQGAKLLRSELFDDVKVGPPTDSDLYPNIPKKEHMNDDGVYPDTLPLNNSLGPDTCPTLSGIIIPAQPEIAAVPAVAPVVGSAGTCGVAPTPVGAPTPAKPLLVLAAPFNTTYCLDEDGSNPLQDYDLSDLAVIESVDTGDASTDVVVKWMMVTGKGTFTALGSFPVGISAVLSSDQRTYTLSGPAVDMPAASLVIKMQADDAADGDLVYKITLENDSGACSGAALKNKNCSTVTDETQACATVILEGGLTSTGSHRIFATMPNGSTSEDTVEKELTSSAVTKSNGQDINDHTEQVALNMQANITALNTSEEPGTELWLPAYEVSFDGAAITVCAPAGQVFNDKNLRVEPSGGVGWDILNSILGFFGGNDKTSGDGSPDNQLKDPNSAWSLAGDVLLNIAGNVAGGIALNMLFNDVSMPTLTIPEEDKDVTVTFLYRGRKVKMPDAYNQSSRSGTPSFSGWGGNWDAGTLTKVEWSDNPAWCLLDYIENRKFGLGEDIVLSSEQKNQLVSDIFEIATYCDQVVDGGPRFSLNTAITDGTKIQILEQLCSVFFGSFVFYKGGLRIKADKEDTDIKLLVNQSNAGDFTYEHATLKSFINKVVVTYVDPDSFYIERTVTVENSHGISKYGEKSAAVFGFGITSEEQALRYANWVLYSEIENALTVSYKGGWDHYNLVPGELVQFEDSNERGSRLAGRCTVSGSNVTFDSDCVAVSGDAFSVIEDDGTVHETTIASVTDGSNIVLNAAPSGTVVPNSTFIIGDQSIGKQLFRVVKVDETSDGVFNTTLQLYNADKYSKITAVNRS